MAAFLPKYLEYQFGLTSGQAAMLVGVIIVPAGAGGTLFGGYLVIKKPDNIFSEFIVILFTGFTLLATLLAVSCFCLRSRFFPFRPNIFLSDEIKTL